MTDTNLPEGMSLSKTGKNSAEFFPRSSAILCSKLPAESFRGTCLLASLVSGNRGMTQRNGMTLIEVLIYITLLSFLLSGFIQYSYSVNLGNIQLIHEIQDKQIQ